MFRLPLGKWGAACFWAALSILSPQLLAQTGMKPASISKSKVAMARAQELFLNKNRQSAVNILLQARLSSGAKSQERDELNEALRESATRFLTDKGQRSFELGISELPLQTAMALTHFREAQAVEDGNLQINEAVVRGLLAAEDCKTAAKELTPLLVYAPVMPHLIELELQVAWCLEDQTIVDNILKKKPADQKLPANLQKVAMAWLKWRQNEAEKALTILREAAVSDAKNPAVTYWLWRVQKDQDLEATAAATSFAKRCRNHEVEFRRRSGSMIEMCLHLNDVEAYLKAKGAENADAAI